MESILVIDDDVEMCGMLAEYLKSEGLLAETVHKRGRRSQASIVRRALFDCARRHATQNQWH
jgi:DNA-binding response OmpR family regulator